MLQTIDTVIAFAVIMVVVSLLITLLVQMVSAALSLRGKNLANALALTFQSIDPKIGGQAHALAAHILRDPILSDSLFTPKERTAVLTIVNSAQLALVQAEKDLIAARDDHMAIKAALVSDPGNAAMLSAVAAAASNIGAKENAVTVAAAGAPAPPNVAPGPTSPWNFHDLTGTWALATAVRPGEIYRMLHELSDLSGTEAALRGVDSDLPTKAADLLRALQMPDGIMQEAQGKLQAVEQIATIFTDDAQRQAVVNSLVSFGTTVERATSQAYDRFQRWFGSAQDRAEQWFQMHMRVTTILFSFLVAFLLQLDSIEIIRQLHGDPGMVQALVSSAPGVLEQGSAVLATNNSQAGSGESNALPYDAYVLWRKQHPLDALAELPPSGTFNAYVVALSARLDGKPDPTYVLNQYRMLCASIKPTAPTPATKHAATEGSPAEAAAAAAGNGAPAAAASPAAGAASAPTTAPAPGSQQSPAYAAYVKWAAKFPHYALGDAAKDLQDKDETAIATALQTHLQEAAQQEEADPGARAGWIDDYKLNFVKSSQKVFQTLQKSLEDTGFDIVPSPFLHRWHKQKWGSSFASRVGHFFPHGIGILITAGLLTLGAPFWFNLLKNLMNLRPAVSTLIERRPQSAPALPQMPDEPVTPS